jgi:hypothetical protein
MLPNIRAVIAAIAGAAALMVIAFGVVAMFRVAQESRASLLHADLAQRGRAAPPEHRPVPIIETPGPTVVAKAPEMETTPQPPSAAESMAPRVMENERAPDPIVTASVPENQPIESEPPPAPEMQTAVAQPKAEEPAPREEAVPLVIAAGPQTVEQSTALPELQASEPEPQTSESNAPSPLASSAMGGPSPEEIAEANARHKAAQRARARKAAAEMRKAAAEKRKLAAEKARKVLAARLARERKAAARRVAAARAKEQATSTPPIATQPSGFNFYPTGSFNSAPFGNTFNAGSAVTTGSPAKPR